MKTEEGTPIVDEEQPEVEEEVVEEPAAGAEEESTEETPTSEDTETTSQKEKDGVQKRIDELVHDREEMRRENTRLIEVIATSQKPKPDPVKEPEPTPKPKQDDFDTYEEFIEALTDWKVEEKSQKESAKIREDIQRETAATARQESLRQKFNKGREKYADFDEKVIHGNIQVPTQALDAIAESDHAAEIAYFIATNPDKIAGMTPIRVVMLVGELEAGFSRPVTKPTPQTDETSPPEPIEPLSGGSAATEKDLDKMTYAEYEAKREAQIKAKKGIK